MNQNQEFNSYKDFFYEETGLAWKEHKDLYIQYVQAKALTIIQQNIIDIKMDMHEIKMVMSSS